MVMGYTSMSLHRRPLTKQHENTTLILHLYNIIYYSIMDMMYKMLLSSQLHSLH